MGILGGGGSAALFSSLGETTTARLTCRGDWAVETASWAAAPAAAPVPAAAAPAAAAAAVAALTAGRPSAGAATAQSPETVATVVLAALAVWAAETGAAAADGGVMRHLLFSLGVKVQDLVADVFQHVHGDILNKLLPPSPIHGLGSPLLNLKLAQAPCEIHHRDRYDLRLPLQRQGGAEAVIYKCPRHLNQLLNFVLITFELLCIFE